MHKIRFYTAGAMELTSDSGTSWRYQLDDIVQNNDFLSSQVELVHPEIPSDPKEAESNTWKSFLKDLEDEKTLFNTSLLEAKTSYIFPEKTDQLNKIKGILTKDWETMKSVNAILCFMDINSANSTGTVGEISIAYTHQIPFYTWIDSDYLLKGPHRIWTTSALAHSQIISVGNSSDWEEFLTLATTQELQRYSQIYGDIK